MFPTGCEGMSNANKNKQLEKFRAYEHLTDTTRRNEQIYSKGDAEGTALLTELTNESQELKQLLLTTVAEEKKRFEGARAVNCFNVMCFDSWFDFEMIFMCSEVMSENMEIRTDSKYLGLFRCENN